MTDEAGRSATAQLATARHLLAQFEAQITEYEAMNREERRTPRGRDLTARIAGLRQGHTTWTARAAQLEPLAAAEAAERTEKDQT